MKDVIEKFCLASTQEVLERFADFGGDRTLYGRDWLYIPGTRDPSERILLVGHADTVFTSPPAKLEWAGNMARGGYSSSQKKNDTPGWLGRGDPSKQVVVIPEPEEVPADLKGVDMEKKVITFNNREYSLREWEEARAKGEIPFPNAPVVGGSKKEEAKQEDKRVIGFPAAGTGGRHPSGANTSANRPASGANTSNNNNRGSSGTSYGSSYGGSSYGWSGGSSPAYKSRGGWKSGGMGADDRVGDALIWLMRRSGHSILITDGEESGGIGAKEAAKAIPHLIAEHVFAIEIDRAGDQEMVFYDVSTPEFEKYMLQMTGSHWSIGRGSYTDIKDICRAGDICGVNMAAGYFNQHTSDEKFVYDFWLRTFKVIQHMTTMKEHPKFELPRPKVVEAPKSSGASTAGSGGSGSGGSRPVLPPVSTGGTEGKAQGGGHSSRPHPRWMDLMSEEEIEQFYLYEMRSDDSRTAYSRLDDEDYDNLAEDEEAELRHRLRAMGRGPGTPHQLFLPDGMQVEASDLAHISQVDVHLIGATAGSDQS